MIWSLGAPALAATLTVGPSGGYATLGDALDDARTGDVVQVQPGRYEEVVSIGRTGVTVEATDGPDATVLAFPVGYGWSAPVVYSSGDGVVLRGFTVDGAGTEAALAVGDGALTGEDLVLRGSSRTNLWVNLADVTLRDSELRAVAGVYARHVEAYDAELALDGVTVSKGYSRTDGGGILTVGSSVTLTGCRILDNVGRFGGGVNVEFGSDDVLVVEDTLFERNTSWAFGGGLRIAGQGTATVARSTFRGNHASEGFGALDVYGAQQLVVTDGWLEGNDGDGFGGAVGVIDVRAATLERNTFLDNHSGDHGGAIRVDGSTQHASVRGNTFCGNTAAEFGGALALEGYDTLTAEVENNVLIANDAPSGSAIGVWRAVAQIDQVTIAGAATGDAAVWFADASGGLVNDVFADLSAPAVGADDYSDAVLTWSLVWDVGGASIGIPSEPSVTEADPAFAAYVADDCGSDLRPGRASPLVDGGDPERADADGSRSDLGAYGGEGAVEVIDVDGDGAIEADCAPWDPASGSGGEDAPGDGREPDCDRREACYLDRDRDGLGRDTLDEGPLGCDAPGWAATAGDCDDEDDRLTECGALPSAWYCATGPRSPGGAALVVLALALSARRAGRRAR